MKSILMFSFFAFVLSLSTITFAQTAVNGQRYQYHLSQVATAWGYPSDERSILKAQNKALKAAQDFCNEDDQILDVNGYQTSADELFSGITHTTTRVYIYFDCISSAGSKCNDIL